MVRLNGEIKRSPVGDFLAKHYGQTVSRADFDAAVARAWGPQSVKAFKLTCNGNPAYLTEMQISLNAATINAPLATSAFLPSLTRVTAAHSLSSIRLATSAKRDADWKTPSAGWCCTLNVRFITSNCRQLSV